ncbi:aldehyde dehydrogenase family protein [Streptomyces sp. SCSIO 75703]|uniref:aldehyde dehydrogenase family protein n=1 Tax=unclassified Streptomyces TaxID=2593676 RepID=UPI0006B3FB82|nr:aldehyde dehydrogenase family protein [Streptomyces sp. TP-A0875]
MAAPPYGPIRIDALGARGPYRALARTAVTDVSGRPMAELSLVPRLFVGRTLRAMRRAEPLPADERTAAIVRAARVFAEDTVAGLPADAYARVVSRVGGTPVGVVRAALRSTAERLSRVHESVRQARPAGAVDDWRDVRARSGAAVWARRGEVLAVHAPGNHPGTHSLWPQALALGYRVAVRPSRRDPFTPHRLITALHTAGFGHDQVTLLPTEHDLAGSLREGADRSLVYGGADVVRRYAGDPATLLQGPGRTKILVTADTDWREHLDVIVDSVSAHGGAGCVNATTVLVEGDPSGLCAALAERLGALTGLPPENDEAVLPVRPVETARAIEAHLLRTAVGARPWLGGEGIVQDLGDGSAALLPAVHQLARPDAPQAAVELPFPCVWVAPWTPRDGIAPLRDSLALTALTRDASLVDRLLAEPGIANVYVGGHRTYVMDPGLPHDGYLGEFLMRSKTVIRD